MKIYVIKGYEDRWNSYDQDWVVALYLHEHKAEAECIELNKRAEGADFYEVVEWNVTE